MKLLINHQSKLHKFLDIQRKKDGSFYISPDRKPREPQDNYTKKPGEQGFTKISPKDMPRYLAYHTTGRVNYHGLVSSDPHYYEPLTEITQLNFALGISIPSAMLLDDYNDTYDPKSDDIYMDQESSERFTMGITIAPLAVSEISVSAARYLFEDVALFVHSIDFNVCAPSPQHFVYFAPPSLFHNQRIGKFEAELAYVQGKGDREIVVDGPNSNGEYTMFFSTVMRVPPNVIVKLHNPKFRFELRKNDQPHKMTFRIIGKGDLVRETDLRPIIKSIVLDAELH